MRYERGAPRISRMNISSSKLLHYFYPVVYVSLALYLVWNTYYFLKQFFINDFNVCVKVYCKMQTLCTKLFCWWWWTTTTTMNTTMAIIGGVGAPTPKTRHRLRHHHRHVRSRCRRAAHHTQEQAKSNQKKMFDESLAQIFRTWNPAKLSAERGGFHAVRVRTGKAHGLTVGRERFEEALLTFWRNWLGTFNTRAEFDFFESGKRKTFWRTVTIWGGELEAARPVGAVGRAERGELVRKRATCVTVETCGARFGLGEFNGG